MFVLEYKFNGKVFRAEFPHRVLMEMVMQSEGVRPLAYWYEEA